MVNAVIDTGADTSIIKASIADLCGLDREKHGVNLLASTSQRVQIKEKAFASFRFYTIYAKVEFAILDSLSADALLGVDFLQKYKIVIDVESRCLWHKREDGGNI